jgi:dTDP-4-amino-4,6-dideoxygalactose transaminase
MLTPFEKPILVTKPFLPPIEEYRNGLQEIWSNVWLTNNGPVLQRYTRRLEAYWGTENVCLFNNGTLALQIGLQGLKVEGEAITTPFTFVATAHALYWNRVQPVFVDIEPDFYTLDPRAVEAAITPRTTAILAVHVFGLPCRHQELAAIAQRHGLKLIYDAAHAFGVSADGRSLASWGDLTMFSFHATKLYHSIEGGALTFQEAPLKKTFDYLKNFGIESETEVVMHGTNAKMNEFQAVMGLLVLDQMETLVASRRAITEVYRERLAAIPGIRIPPALPAGVAYNYAYMPVEILPDYPLSRDELYERLKVYNVFTRRYFYPLLTDLRCYGDQAPADPLTVARGVADRILTLPIYHDLTLEDVHRICDMVQTLQ